MSFDQDPSDQANISGADFAQMVDEMKELRAQLSAITAERDALKARIEEAEKQEPLYFVWIGEGSDGGWSGTNKKYYDSVKDEDRMKLYEYPIPSPDIQGEQTMSTERFCDCKHPNCTVCKVIDRRHEQQPDAWQWEQWGTDQSIDCGDEDDHWYMTWSEHQPVITSDNAQFVRNVIALYAIPPDTQEAIRKAVKEEREACAKICEELESAQPVCHAIDGDDCADAIRSRSTKDKSHEQV